MNQRSTSTLRGLQLRARKAAVGLAGALVLMAAGATAAMASGTAPGLVHPPGFTPARLSANRGRFGGLDDLSGRLARARDLQNPLADPFTSIELGAPPSVPVGANPSGIAMDEANHTVYVVNQADDTVSVIDARACDAHGLSGCGGALATISLGPGGLQNGPISAVVSPDGGTLYVTFADGANEVAVIDAADCNATRTSGCADGPVATVATGNVPLDAAEDPQSDTLYVVNAGDNTVSLIDGRTCNGQRISGCGETAPTVPVGTAPFAVAVDPQTNTVYVANLDDNTVSVIDASRCNAERAAGCPTDPPPVQAVGGAPGAIAVSPNGATVYVANSGLNFEGALVPGGNTVSVLDAGACNGGHPGGCSAVPPPAVAVGGQQNDQPQSLAVDQQTQDVYLADSVDDTVSVIDGSRCNAHDVSGCAQPALSEQTGAEPNALVAAPNEHTIYVTDGADGAVAVIDDRACTDEHPAGCRPAPAPAAPLGAGPGALIGGAVDAAQHTAYIADDGVSESGPYALDLIDTSSCNAADTSGCNPQPPLPTVALPDFVNSVYGVAVDPSTDTIYVSLGFGSTNELQVIDATSCNVTDSSCSKQATVMLGDNDGGGPVAVDSATHTVYVAGGADISVIDARHCYGADMSGCATQTPAIIPVDQFPQTLTVGPDTLYVSDWNDPTVPAVVDVFDTQHCQADDTTQCTQTPAAVPVGVDPTGTVLDVAHDTLYVVDNANGESPGLLSMIDTTHCNGDDSSACASENPPTTPLPRSPFGAVLDPSTNTLSVTNFSDASVSRIDTATCNAATQAGCQPFPPQVIVGNGPFPPALDPATHTVYVPNFYDSTVSVISSGP